MRRKLTLQYIAKDAERKASYKKRKKGLLKKVNELSTLCGVDACAIINSEFDREPEVWPSKEGLDRVINRFNDLSEIEQTKKMVNQESFTKERIKKLEEQLRKLKRENKQKQMTLVMNQCLAGQMSVQNLSLVELHDLGSVVKQSLRDITMRLEEIEKKNGESSPIPISGQETLPIDATATRELVVSPIPANYQQNITSLMQTPSVVLQQGISMANMQNFQVAPVTTPMPPMSAPQLHNFQHPMVAPSPVSFPDIFQSWSPLSCQAFEDLMMPPFVPNDEAESSNTED